MSKKLKKTKEHFQNFLMQPHSTYLKCASSTHQEMLLHQHFFRAMFLHSLFSLIYFSSEYYHQFFYTLGLCRGERTRARNRRKDLFFYLIINIFLISIWEFIFVRLSMGIEICKRFYFILVPQKSYRSLTVNFCKTWNIWCSLLIYLIFVHNSFFFLIEIDCFRCWELFFFWGPFFLIILYFNYVYIFIKLEVYVCAKRINFIWCRVLGPLIKYWLESQ